MTLIDLAPYLLVLIILLINIALWSSFKRNKGNRQLEFWQKVGSTLQKPWEKEDRTYRELSERVKNLKEKPSNNSSQEDHSSLEIDQGK